MLKRTDWVMGQFSVFFFLVSADFKGQTAVPTHRVDSINEPIRARYAQRISHVILKRLHHLLVKHGRRSHLFSRSVTFMTFNKTAEFFRVCVCRHNSKLKHSYHERWRCVLTYKGSGRHTRLKNPRDLWASCGSITYFPGHGSVV